VDFSDPGIWIILAVVIIIFVFIGIYFRILFSEQRRITTS